MQCIFLTYLFHPFIVIAAPTFREVPMKSEGNWFLLFCLADRNHMWSLIIFTQWYFWKQSQDVKLPTNFSKILKKQVKGTIICNILGWSSEKLLKMNYSTERSVLLFGNFFVFYHIYVYIHIYLNKYIYDKISQVCEKHISETGSAFDLYPFSYKNYWIYTTQDTF